jgi:23S rRNA pseudouridine2605 synthase
VEILMAEGQNREIRRLFARVGHKIMKLERIGYGPLRLGRLPRGEYRDLTREELAALHAVLERNQDSEPPPGFSSPGPRRDRSRTQASGSRSGTGRGQRSTGNTGTQRGGPRAGSDRRARRPHEGTDDRTPGGRSRSQSADRRPGANAANQRGSGSQAANRPPQSASGSQGQHTGRARREPSGGGDRQRAGGPSGRAARPPQRTPGKRVPAKKRPPGNRRGQGRR